MCKCGDACRCKKVTRISREDFMRTSIGKFAAVTLGRVGKIGKVESVASVSYRGVTYRIV